MNSAWYILIVVNLLVIWTCAAPKDEKGYVKPKIVDSISSKKVHSSEDQQIASNDVEAARSVNERFPSAVLFAETCGGVIIDPSWVITSAHCTMFMKGHRVLAGTNRTDDRSGVSATVKKLYIHPKFSVGPVWLDAEKYGLNQIAARWDFMLVKLKQPLPIDGKRIAVIPIDDQPNIPVGLNVSFAGYGTDHYGGFMSHQMHAKDLITVSDGVCAKLIEYDAQDMFCTKGLSSQNFACNGDSGSPVIGDGRLLGLVSWVEGDTKYCRAGALTYVARVSQVRDWIKNVTGI